MDEQHKPNHGEQDRSQRGQAGGGRGLAGLWNDGERECESLKDLLLEMAGTRSTEDLLHLIVDRFAERPHVALARIWLICRGDRCESCDMRGECPDQAKCLHLVASAGTPLSDVGADWTRLDGPHSRFPLGVRKVGRIATGMQGLEQLDLEADGSWLGDPDWARREGILGFGGQALAYQGEIMGVVGVFSRIRPEPECAVWMRMVADTAGAAIANARAFEEIERLRQRLEMENAYLREEVLETRSDSDIVGESGAIGNILQQIELVAPTDAGVLILGESGTGKELVAREIHKKSRRSNGPMIRVNCASVPRELYESEFFGHVKGAFTGALRDRAGRFELAHGGTLFLDEVGEIPLELQSKLLRVLQEGQYERIGDHQTREVDVRIVAATNRDLKKEVEVGRFRQDLYYRLNVFPIEVAPLRRRKEDISLLAARFLALGAARMHRAAPRLTQANVLQLQAYDWPGNVRELQNVIERAIITSRGDALQFDLPQSFDPSAAPVASSIMREATASTGDGGVVEPMAGGRVLTDVEMKQLERDNLVAALERSGWRIYGEGGAAELLGVRPTTFTSRMKRFGIERPL